MLTATDPTEVISDAPADLTDDAVLPCWTTDPDLWFAEAPAELERAKTLCLDCPVRAQCLAAALERAESDLAEAIRQQGAAAEQKARHRPGDRLRQRVRLHDAHDLIRVGRHLGRGEATGGQTVDQEDLDGAAPLLAPRLEQGFQLVDDLLGPAQLRDGLRCGP